MEKYISTYTYFRQHEQCVPSTSFFEAKMNKLYKNDISENEKEHITNTRQLQY